MSEDKWQELHQRAYAIDGEARTATWAMQDAVRLLEWTIQKFASSPDFEGQAVHRLAEVLRQALAWVVDVRLQHDPGCPRPAVVDAQCTCKPTQVVKLRVEQPQAGGPDMPF